MLVLTRKTGEAIMIGEQVEVKVVSVRGGKVKLGFTSPQQVSIRRNEIAKSEKRSQSPQTAPPDA